MRTRQGHFDKNNQSSAPVGDLQILLQRHGNRWRFGRTGLDMHGHAPLDHGFLGRGAEHANAAVFLPEIRELVEHGLDLQRREKGDDVVLDVLQLQDVVVHRAVILTAL